MNGRNVVVCIGKAESDSSSIIIIERAGDGGNQVYSPKARKSHDRSPSPTEFETCLPVTDISNDLLPAIKQLGDVELNQWTRFSRPVTMWHIGSCIFGAQCQFIT